MITLFHYRATTRGNERQGSMPVSAVGENQRERRLACRAGLMLPAVLLAACAATLELGEGAYASCRNLGDLALTAENRANAEQRMRAQVVELGGDTLLFGERARAEGGTVPEEVVERRNQLTSAAVGASQPDAFEVSPRVDDDSLHLPDGEADVRPDRGRVRRGRISVEPVAAAPGELWYYGAALRCKR